MVGLAVGSSFGRVILGPRWVCERANSRLMDMKKRDWQLLLMLLNAEIEANPYPCLIIGAVCWATAIAGAVVLIWRA